VLVFPSKAPELLELPPEPVLGNKTEPTIGGGGAANCMTLPFSLPFVPLGLGVSIEASDRGRKGSFVFEDFDL
jgi:hypothetical protein